MFFKKVTPLLLDGLVQRLCWFSLLLAFHIQCHLVFFRIITRQGMSTIRIKFVLHVYNLTEYRDAMFFKKVTPLLLDGLVQRPCWFSQLRAFQSQCRLVFFLSTWKSNECVAWYLKGTNQIMNAKKGWNWQSSINCRGSQKVEFVEHWVEQNWVLCAQSFMLDDNPTSWNRTWSVGRTAQATEQVLAGIPSFAVF